MDKLVERRLAAILVVDVVGYSRLIGLDEAGTLRRLKALRRELVDPAILSARGRIVKSTGDGLIAEFPSPVRAVACAVAIQKAMALRGAGEAQERALRLRVGINLGDVVAEPDGDLYGDGVNVAARLEPLAEPGGICISRSVHDQVRDKLRYPFEDRGEQELRNIARPVGVYALPAAAIPGLAEGEERPDEADPAPRRRPLRAVLLAGGVLSLLAAGALGWSYRTGPARAPAPGPPATATRESEPAPRPRLSIVVLPFANLSNDPEQDFFADGITEDLTTDLSHLAGSFVIARNTAFTYKGKPTDVKQVGRDLGVRYALEGSVRRTGERVVVNAQLISAETGAHLWADRFEGERARLGELQAEFVGRLARSLDIQLIQAESQRSLRERPDNPDAADLAMRGWAAVNKPRSRESLGEAVAFFEQALRRDPTNGFAKLGLARAMSSRVISRWSPDPAAEIAEADRIVTAYLAEHANDPMAFYVKAEIYKYRKNFDAALPLYLKSVELDKNFAQGYATIGNVKILSGKSAESFAYTEKALRLSPRDPAAKIWKYFICHANAHLARWDEAITTCNQAIADGPFWQTYIDLAAAYAWKGRASEAGHAVAELLKLMPGYTVEKWAKADWSDDPTFLDEYRRITEGLRKAGLPDA
ncbi:adenylate/guanylate cyclase with TPR repeats [Methylobacterium sp. 4-46]|uniref:adenylate/guanylate cyclase domain-containing protein n=1 Tax=unclassified Methylobacterium TaxID=2615210 RepID=UPI000165C991|nr:MULTISPECIES: adenylate/guanylate cyclase domain-containing protein [Methylobacterium]ACA15089.1 adenylate/guanylate cyclase with TPR repeats [Methylobacterium sp. 4-46]WFT80823.1 adenylate/guanylate cyclase domain-containing protein [Methylobacterium nodulans]